MNTFVLTDGQSVDIKEGASMRTIVAVVNDFAELGTVATKLTAAGNLDSVQFKTGDVVTGEYAAMKLESPLFKDVDVVDGHVEATFSIREKTEVEKRLDALEETADYLVVESLV